MKRDVEDTDGPRGSSACVRAGREGSVLSLEKMKTLWSPLQDARPLKLEMLLYENMACQLS